MRRRRNVKHHTELDKTTAAALVNNAQGPLRPAPRGPNAANGAVGREPNLFRLERAAGQGDRVGHGVDGTAPTIARMAISGRSEKGLYHRLQERSPSGTGVESEQPFPCHGHVMGRRYTTKQGVTA